MVINNDSTHFLRTWPWWRFILTGLNTLALVLSVTLSWHFLTGTNMLGCDGGSPCDQVLNSKWSMLAGVLPVSGLALGVYLAMLVASFFIGPATEVSIRRLAWGAIQQNLAVPGGCQVRHLICVTARACAQGDSVLTAISRSPGDDCD